MSNEDITAETPNDDIEEDNIGDAIRCAGKLLGHFHTGEANRRPPGQGRMPWSEISQALHDIGYNGNIVMEPFIHMGGRVGQDIKVWRDMSSGASPAEMDRLALEALKFEHRIFENISDVVSC